MSCGYVEMSCEYVDMRLQHLAQITSIWLWKHLAFAIIIDEIELDLHHLGNNLQMQHHTLSESRQPIANAFPTPMEHHVSNEAGGPSWSSLSYGAILTYVLSSTSSMRTSSQIQRASNMG